MRAEAFIDASVSSTTWTAPTIASSSWPATSCATRRRFGFHDCLIIAAAQSAGCTRRLTEELPHGQPLEGLTVVDPIWG